MPIITPTIVIPDVKIIRPKRDGDQRGFFSETYSQKAFAEAGIAVEFVQDNHTFSAAKGTLRGLHFQTPPFAQAKLVRVVRGAILDVAVDLRVGSPTYGKHVSMVISAAEWNQVYVPIGFAHGLLTLEPDTEVLYKVSNFYAPAHDKGIRWNDASLEIEWPMSAENLVMSERDKVLPLLAEIPGYFRYEPEMAR
jgi:dTDP-4-dehydrorhamnose 3,5-epimerase